jgi:plastocyanin
MRRLVASATVLVTVALVAVGLMVTTVLAAPEREVRTTGDERVVPNAMVQATLRFTPGPITVTSGATVTWTHDDRTTEPHTVTIVEAFPEATLEAIFGCGAPGGPCAAALDAHFAGGTFHPVVEAGEPGLDSPGDSLFLADDQTISATVSAPSGSTLKYLCAIHPWMQGTITVR